MLQHISDFSIKGSRERSILMDVNFDDSRTKAPVVLFAHGFKGFKDWGHYNLVSDYLANAGYVCVKFNFSHNGTTIEKPTEFADLEAFGHNNLTTELNDLGCVIDYVSSSDFVAKAYADINALYLIGHSRGGGIALLKAREDTRIRKVIGLAPVHKYGNYFNDAIDAWEKDDVRYEKNSRTGQTMPMYWQYIEDLRANATRLDIEDAVRHLLIPTLIIHGTEDKSLPYIHSLNMRKLNDAVEVVLIDHADHVFGSKHPWESTTLPEQTEMWLDEAVRFFKAK